MVERAGKVKLVLIGDERVGKTTLRKTFMGEKQTVTYMATIGADFAKRITSLSLDDITYQVETLIWDLAGQDAYKIVRESFYEGSNGALLVVDITRPETIASAEGWLEELRKNTGGNIPYVILANKTDLKEHPQALTIDEARKRIFEVLSDQQQQALNFLGTSALTGENVNIAFQILLEAILRGNADM